MRPRAASAFRAYSADSAEKSRFSDVNHVQLASQFENRVEHFLTI